MILRILIVDDHQITRYGLVTLIEKRSDMEVVGEAKNGWEAIDLVDKLTPDIVIMDINMPGLNGIDATRQILETSPSTRVIALSMYSDGSYVEGMLRAGASGYLVKDCAFDELIQAILTVVDGKPYLSPSATDVVVKKYLRKRETSATDSDPSSENKLSSREKEVLQLIVEGFDPEQIAARLYISTKTVSTHRRHIMEKLQMFNTADLVKYALRKGLIDI